MHRAFSEGAGRAEKADVVSSRACEQKKRNAPSPVFRTFLFLFSRAFLFYFFRITNDFAGTEAATAPSVGVPLETSTDFA